MPPRNKWLAAALLWLAAGIYALLFRETSSSQAPPFPHFDKLAHALLFFAQTWLLAKVWLSERRPVPFAALVVFGLLYAAASEWVQHTFTATRQGDVWDMAADLLGVAAALHLAHLLQRLRQERPSRRT